MYVCMYVCATNDTHILCIQAKAARQKQEIEDHLPKLKVAEEKYRDVKVFPSRIIYDISKLHARWEK